VQVVAYECAQASNSVSILSVGSSKDGSGEGEANREREDSDPVASSEALQHFYDHLQRVMVATGFLDPSNPRHLMRRIRRYFERNRPSVSELNIFRGILSATEKPFPPQNREP